MRILCFLLGAFSLLSLAACSTDVDVNAPYIERPTVYAVLDAADSIQYLRIQKSFLTINESSVTKVAGTKDSIYYLPSVLRVTLQGLNRRTLAAVGSPIVLQEATDTTKVPGIFYGPDQLIYQTTAVLDTALLYRLTALNTRTQVQVQALTNIVAPIRRVTLVEPQVNAATNAYTFISQGPYISFKNFTRDSVDRFRIDIDLPVDEILRGGTIRRKNVHWDFASDRSSQQYSTGTSIEVRDYFSGTNRQALFNILRTELDTLDTQVESRRLLPLTLTITRVNVPLSQYISANRGYSVLTQTRPFYTNINGGIGVFASRSISSFTCIVDNSFYTTADRRYPSLKFTR